MQTNDPALIKTPISESNKDDNLIEKERDVHVASQDVANRSTPEKIAGESVTRESPLEREVLGEEIAKRDSVDSTYTHADDDAHSKIERNTRDNKGTETFDSGVIDSKHVNDGDNPARQPDRRDQEGSTAFDGNINEETVGSEEQQSDEINDMNRYATIDNAQTRTLTPDEQD